MRGLFPVSEPVLAVVDTLTGPPPHRQVLRAWCARDPQMRETDVASLDTEFAYPTLAPGGRALLFVRLLSVEDRAHEGVFRLDLASGRIDHSGFRFRPRAPWTEPHVAYALSPDGSRALICESWVDRTVDDRRGVSAERLSLTLATFDGSDPRELMTLHGLSRWVHSDEVSVQFSPDGRLAALSVTAAHVVEDLPSWDVRPRPVWGWTRRVMVLDTSTWETKHVYERGSNLAGPAAWGPASDRLLLETELGVTVQHLDGAADMVKTLPVESSENDQSRLLGMLDEERVLYFDVRRRQASIDSIRISDGERTRLRQWPAAVPPRIATAPLAPELWD